MDDIDSLKRQIKELESHLEEQQKSHQAELSKIKTENYEALEASQTRYKEIIKQKKDGAQIRRNDNKWKNIDSIISDSYHLNEDDKKEVDRWASRRFTRPGVVYDNG